MKMLFIKAFIMDIHNTFIGEKKLPKFENFNLAEFLKKDYIEQVMEDYFLLKERNKFSPYDFTHLWEIFERNFLAYIKYPENINLEENFPLKEIEPVIYGNISEETDILDSINFKEEPGYKDDFENKKEKRDETNNVHKTIEN